MRRAVDRVQSITVRLMVYDATCGPLSRVWSLGAALYRRLGRLDGILAAVSC